MRTTLTIDDDVSVLLDRLRREREMSLKEIVNDALRRGLRDMTAAKPREPFRTRTVSLGRLRVAAVDNIGEALAVADGEDYR